METVKLHTEEWTSWADEVGETRSFPRWVGASASTLAGLNISCDEKVYTP